MKQAMIPLAFGGELALCDPWLAPAEADALLASLLRGIDWQQRSIRHFGKEVPQPRLVAWMGDAEAVYTYSGLTLVPRPWTDEVARLRSRVERAAGEPYNSVLLNLYRNGVDSMGLHADDEPELGPDPVIASVSLGAVRTFVMKPRRGNRSTPPVVLSLGHGSLLVMRRGTQRAWVHGVPKQRGIAAPRVNLTFRHVTPGRPSPGPA
jgi:alkylated DNA repair dioxygenase AlkB